ncbi:MAG: hypothetical protein RL562_2750 [Planctomycetota bacterium]
MNRLEGHRSKRFAACRRLIAPLALACVAMHASAGGSSAAPRRAVPPGTVRVLGEDGVCTTGVLERIDAEGWHLGQVAGANADIVIVRAIAGMVELDGWSAWGTGGERVEAVSQPSGMLDLHDGQRLPGALEIDAGVAQWNHRWIGAIPVEIERVSVLRLAGGRAVRGRDDADIVLLLNADRIAGFVESIGSEVAIEPLESDLPEEDGEKPDEPVEDPSDDGARAAVPADIRSIELARIAAIAFAPTIDPPAPGALAWTRDGSVVRYRDLRLDDAGSLAFSLDDPMLSKARAEDTSANLAADVVGVVVSPARLHPISSLPVLDPLGPVDGYRVSGGLRRGPSDDGSDHVLGLSDLVLLGPQRLSFDVGGLGGAGLVLSMECGVLEPAPPDALVGVEVHADGVRIERFVQRSGASAPIAVPLPEGTRRLDLVVDDGGNGIAGDRLLVRRAVVISRPRSDGR